MLLKRVLITLLMCLTFSSTIYASEYVDVVGDKLVAEELYNAFMSSNGSCDAYSYNKHVDVGRLKTNYRLDILRLYLDLNYFPSSYFALGFHDK